MPGMKTYLVTNDWQIPFEDEKIVVKLFLPFLAWLQPDGIIINGDFIDNYELSDFSKDPLKHNLFELERVKASSYLRFMREAAPKAKGVWLGGNHEDRTRRYLWKNAREMGLDHRRVFTDCFKPSKYGFIYMPYHSVIRLGKLDVTHGSVVRAHSALSAKAHFEKRGGSVLIGHTHRMGTYYRTNAKGVYAAFENGCLCRMDPEYVQDPDWQQGWSVVHVGKEGYFAVQQIPVIKHSYIIYGRKVFEV